MASTLGTLNPIRYRGYVYDQESGLYYLQSRYYDPEVGRFLNADTLASTKNVSIGCNVFAYCRNNPVNRIDSDGYDAIWIHESNSAAGFGHSGLLVEDEAIRYTVYIEQQENAPLSRCVFSYSSIAMMCAP